MLLCMPDIGQATQGALQSRLPAQEEVHLLSPSLVDSMLSIHHLIVTLPNPRQHGYRFLSFQLVQSQACHRDPCLVLHTLAGQS